MASGESVRPSLITAADLPGSVIVALDALIGGETVAILALREGHDVRAWRNACPHQGRRLDYVPGKFLIDGGNLVCAAHGASFRLSDGLCVGGPCRGEHLAALAVQRLADGSLRFTDPAARTSS